MEEGTLLTVVTLIPTDKRLLTVSIQPLICSDALLQNTDRPVSRPLEAVHRDAAVLATIHRITSTSFRSLPAHLKTRARVRRLIGLGRRRSGRRFTVLSLMPRCRVIVSRPLCFPILAAIPSRDLPDFQARFIR